MAKGRPENTNRTAVSEEQYNGTVENIIYRNDSNGYTVCEIDCGKGGEIITAVGSMPFLAEGEEVSVTGRWTMHPEYGRQLNVETYEKHLPATEAAIIKYLSSGAVKGIGPVTASRIVKKYGRDTFEVMENHPEFLSEIQGISKAKAAEIGGLFRETAGIRTVMVFFGDYFGPSAAIKIYKAWSSAAVDIAKQNPYRLCGEIDGIGFQGADRFAESLGFPADSPERLKAGIRYVLSYNARQSGHTCLPADKLCESAAKLLGAPAEAVLKALAELIAMREVTQSELDGRRYVFDNGFYRMELLLAQRLHTIRKCREMLSEGDIERMIHTIEYEENITYAAMQKQAIFEALSSGVTVITGGPGTGKTTIIRALLSIFDSMGIPAVLAAPTGRAAKRMSEATGREAKTVHRLLEMEYGEGDEPRFMRTENDPLDARAVIIDEASMLDLPLALALCSAVRPGARLVLIGDADQLPPVGPGNVLHDIIESMCFPTVRLTEIFRQARESLIVRNAHAVNSGEMPELGDTQSDFFFMPRKDDADIAAAVAELCAVRLPKKYGQSVCSGIQVITASRRGQPGTDYLNRMLQERLNPPEKDKKETRVHDKVFREGDRVMQVRNDYDLEWEKDSIHGSGIFNGDIGIIESIDNPGETVAVSFDGRRVRYDFTLLDELEHAYAVTVHKSQGSEYDTVIMPAYFCPPMLMTRNLLYTAVTRAKKMMIIVGRRDAVSAMVENNRQVLRYTALSRRLTDIKDD